MCLRSGKGFPLDTTQPSSGYPISLIIVVVMSASHAQAHALFYTATRLRVIELVDLKCWCGNVPATNVASARQLAL
ncbi:hypothetical protein J6590_013283 [Homalodisca vitripennis]|nr:hypothetical protein J6590_013283 [Homalodisca vitripennis]